ncbi:CPLN1 protein, partial [Aegithalos caudatus]|nr:CPLN1 protein [Aegithalos caudatus]
IHQVSTSAVDNAQEEQNVEETKEEKPKQNIADISVSASQPSQTTMSTISSLASHTSVCAKKQKVKEEVAREEKQRNISETVRQTVQDEMFKLVQLQQINFMSLMQIVQSSFTNVPSMQQMLQQHQSIHLAGSQSAHTAQSNASPKTQ